MISTIRKESENMENVLPNNFIKPIINNNEILKINNEKEQQEPDPKIEISDIWKIGDQKHNNYFVLVIAVDNESKITTCIKLYKNREDIIENDNFMEIKVKGMNFFLNISYMQYVTFTRYKQFICKISDNTLIDTINKKVLSYLNIKIEQVEENLDNEKDLEIQRLQNELKEAYEKLNAKKKSTPESSKEQEKEIEILNERLERSKEKYQHLYSKWYYLIDKIRKGKPITDKDIEGLRVHDKEADQSKFNAIINVSSQESKKRIQNLLNTVDDLEKEIGSLKDQNEKLKSTVKTQDQKLSIISEFESNIEEYKKINLDLCKELENSTKTVADLKDSIASKDEVIAKLESDIKSTAETKSSITESDYIDLKYENGVLSGKVSVYESIFSNIQYLQYPMLPYRE